MFNLLNEAYEPLFGFSALSQRQMDEMVKQYDRVRYGEEIPGSEALERLDSLLEKIR